MQALKTLVFAAILLAASVGSSEVKKNEIKTQNKDSQKIVISSLAGKTKFMAIGKPAMLRIAGEGQGPTGHIAIENKKVNGEFIVQLKDLNTGIELRDDHMKNKFLEVEKFPTAKLSIENLELEKAVTEISTKIEKVPFTGKLELRGIVKPVSGQFDIEPDGTSFKVNARYALSLSDFNIQIPTYAGIKVADKVDVEVAFSFSK